MSSEKLDDTIATTSGSDHRVGDVEDVVFDPKEEDDQFEVFKKNTDGVDFRLVGWPRASVIFLKSKVVQLELDVRLLNG